MSGSRYAYPPGGSGGGGTGDVVGPSSATDNAIARFDTTTGKLLQNSLATVSDVGTIQGVNLSATANLVVSPNNITDQQSMAQAGTTLVTLSTQMVNTSAAGSSLANVRFANSALGAANIFAKSRATTIGSRAAVVTDDILGNVGFDGDDGTNFVEAARIRSLVDGTVTTGSVPGRLEFLTTAVGATSATTALMIDSANQFIITDGGNVVMGTTTGTKIGTSTSQKIGFFGTAPVAQQAATTDIHTVLSNLGLAATGTAWPISTSGSVALTGGFRLGISNRTTGVTLTTTSVPLNPADATTAPFTITLPTTTTGGIFFYIKKVDATANAVTVAGTIDGATNYVLANQNDYILVTSTTTSGAWNVYSRGNGSATLGTVSSVSVVSANGLAGTVATSTTTPVITLSTTVTGLLKGNGTAISAAVAGTDYVAIGANSNLTNLTGLTGAISSPTSLTFTGTASPTYTQGKLVFDTDNDSLTFYNSDSNISLQVGQEEYIRVKNVTGSTIANGAVVYINGASAGLPTVALAKADAGATVIGAGLATESIANNAIGYVTCIGNVNGLDTSGFTAGQTVYISAVTAGALTATAPVAPNYRYRVGIVGTSSATVGTIHVTPSTASLGNGSANQVAGINAAGTAQEYKTITAGTGITVTPGTGTITIAATGGSSAVNLTDAIAQTGHGFSVGNVVRYNGTSYVKSQSNSAANAEVTGIVSSVVDANNFVLLTQGFITGLSGLTAGSTYFLDPSTAGATTTTEPSTVGQVSKPVFEAVSTTTAFFKNYRGIVIASSGSTGVAWTEVTGTTQSAAVNSGYITNNAGLVTVTLPSTAAQGSIIEISGKGAGGWKVAQNASQLINFGSKVTTTGTGGSLASTNAFDTLRLLCITANTTFIVLSSVGNITVV